MMLGQTLVILIGLAVAGWGHLLVHDFLGAAGAWSRLDGLFPASVRSSPPFAGRVLLLVGAMLVLVPVLG